MTRVALTLFQSALGLPEPERAELAARLINSIDPGDEETLDAAWSEEIRRRLDDVESDRVHPIPWDVERRYIPDDPDGLKDV